MSCDDSRAIHRYALYGRSNNEPGRGAEDFVKSGNSVLYLMRLAMEQRLWWAQIFDRREMEIRCYGRTINDQVVWNETNIFNESNPGESHADHKKILQRLR